MREHHEVHSMQILHKPTKNPELADFRLSRYVGYSYEHSQKSDLRGVTAS